MSLLALLLSLPLAGIGAQVMEIAEWQAFYVSYVLEGGGAEEAGIKPGDQLLEVDGRPTSDLDIEGLGKLVRGKPGSKVTITLFRAGDTTVDTFTVQVTRKKL